MIASYRDKRTRDFASGNWIRAFSGFEHAARLKIDRLEAATSIMDLAALPGKGQYSIRINDQWRICFEWTNENSGPTNVEIVDYH